jgi:cytochrome c-type protein NapC
MKSAPRAKRLQRCRVRLAGWLQCYPVAGVILFFVGGILFWGAFNTSLEITNREAFCISCHEMEINVYKEYRQTVHYSNPTGIRATCPDCHVPREWQHMVVRKITATNELMHKLLGSIDTPEKFNAKRLQLAGYVWKQMHATDSRECRNCHGIEYMDLATQQPASRRKHERAKREGLTCIDCHMGIAHRLPADFDADGRLHEQYRRDQRPCGDCHHDLAQSEAGGW